MLIAGESVCELIRIQQGTVSCVISLASMVGFLSKVLILDILGRILYLPIKKRNYFFTLSLSGRMSRERRQEMGCLPVPVGRQERGSDSVKLCPHKRARPRAFVRALNIFVVFLILKF